MGWDIIFFWVAWMIFVGYEWLEELLEDKNITLLMVTHDRYFLDRVCDEILELDGGILHRYKGN